MKEKRYAEDKKNQLIVGDINLRHNSNSLAQGISTPGKAMPDFFGMASSAPGLVPELWELAKSSYLDSPLPLLFKERLFVHLSRFCPVRCCVARYVAFLINTDKLTGNAEVGSGITEQIVELLKRPLPGPALLNIGYCRLEAYGQPADIPLPCTLPEMDLFDVLTVMFTEPRRAERARQAVRKAVGDVAFETLTAYLAFMRTVHYWADTHPELTCRPDEWEQIAKHKELSRLLFEPAEAEQKQARELPNHTEQELQQSKELLQATLNSSLDMIQVFKAVRDDSNKIVDFTWVLNNKKSEEIYGDVIGKSLLQNNPGVVKAGIFKSFVEVTESGIPQQYEKHYSREQFNGWYYQSVVKLDDGVATSTADITERKITEQQLARQQEEYRSLVENTPDVITRWNKHLKLIFANSAFEKKVGASNASLYGSTFAEMGVPDDVTLPYMQSLTKVFETGLPSEHYNTFTSAKGEYYFYSRMVPEKNAEGETETVLAIARDITQIKKTELELKHSKDLQEAVFNTAQHAITVFKSIRNEQGHIVDFKFILSNGVADRFLGANTAGKTLRTVTPGYVDEYNFELMVRTVASGKPRDSVLHFNYGKIPIYLHTQYNKLDDGVVLLHENITQRIKTEEERLKNFTLLQQSEQTALMGSWEYDLPTGKFIWSDGMYRLFDLKRGTEVQPETYLQYVTDKDRPIVMRLIDYLKSAKQSFEETIEIVVKGNVKTITIKATAIYNADGIPLRLLGVDIDITAAVTAQQKIKRMESERQQEIFRATLHTQEEERKRIAESLHNGLGQMLYGVKLSLEQVDINEAHKQADNESALLKTSQLLSDAIKESRRISHELVPTILEDFGLKEAVADICQQFSGAVLFEYKFFGLKLPLDKYLETAIYRMVQELMMNIVKHARATKGRVKIEARKKTMLITVEDNGRWFDATGTKVKGIGLQTIRSKVNLLNGKLNIDTVPGGGTIVSIKLPVKAG